MSRVRFHPDQRDTPKCLFPVRGRPLLFHHLDNLLRIGIEDITVITGYKAEVVWSRVGSSSRYSRVRCIFNPFYQYTDSIVSLWLSLKAAHTGRKGIIVISGDRVFHPEIYRTLKKVDGFTLITLGPKEYSFIPKDSIKVVENRVVAIGEESSYVFGGALYVSQKKISYLLTLVERLLFTEEGSKKWYLEGIRTAVREGEKVRTVIFPFDFCVNVNYPQNLESSQIREIVGEITDD